MDYLLKTKLLAEMPKNMRDVAISGMPLNMLRGAILKREHGSGLFIVDLLKGDTITLLSEEGRRTVYYISVASNGELIDTLAVLLNFGYVLYFDSLELFKSMEYPNILCDMQNAHYDQ